MIMNALLLGDPSPSLRIRASVELDGAAEDDEDVRAWRAEIATSALVQPLLDRLVTEGRSQTIGYLLCQLAYLGYDGPEIATAVDALFAQQQPDGSWSQHVDDHDGEDDHGGRSASDGPRFITMHTVVPLRGLAAAGFATDPRAERAFEWLLAARLPDGSWPAGPKADFGRPGMPSQPEREYRRLTNGEGCRSATTGAVACLALHPDRRGSGAARDGVDHLLAAETRDGSTLGWEVSRLTGLERAMGQITFYVTVDPAFLLDLASRCGVSTDDRRVRDLMTWLEARRGPYGLWEHHTHPQLSRWLTFDLESSLRRLGEAVSRP